MTPIPNEKNKNLAIMPEELQVQEEPQELQVQEESHALGMENESVGTEILDVEDELNDWIPNENEYAELINEINVDYDSILF